VVATGVAVISPARFALAPAVHRVLVAALIVLATGCGPLPIPGRQAAHVRDPSRFPAELAPLRAKIDASELAYVRIVPEPRTGLRPWQSKFRGVAYLPKGQAYPRDPHGDPLVLLVQVNFAEMPALAGYPDRGLLQLFIAPDQSAEHVWGMASYDEKPWNDQRYFASLQDQRHFRVLFHPQVVTDPAQLDTPPPVPAGLNLPIDGEAAMRFERDVEPVLIDDYRFAKVFGAGAYEYFPRFGARSEDIGQAYVDFSRSWSPAKVGGYASFVQEDPRQLQPDEDWLLLIEMQSGGYLGTDGFEIMWGDAGVGGLFIRRADLARRDFSKVAYYWDNH
jgi:uncharacterized protein YwqG